jgi:drug/metabolite transporter (DMT)-like permease
MKLSSNQLGSFYAIFSGLLYGFIGFFSFKIMQEGVSIPSMMFWRFAISALVISPFVIIKKSFSNCHLKDCFKGFFFGAIFYCLSPIFFCMASRYIGTGLSMVIFFVYPLIVIAANVFLYKVKVSKIYHLSITIILIGLLFIVDLSVVNFNITGITLSILSGLFYAFYIVGSKKNTLNPLVSTLMVSIGCMSTSLILTIFDNSFISSLNLNALSYLVGYGTICSAFPILIFLESLKYISAEKAAILSVFEPVFVVIIGVILLGEVLSVAETVGVFAVLLGAMIAMLDKKPIYFMNLFKRRFNG